MLKLKTVHFVCADRDEIFSVDTAHSVRTAKVFLDINTDGNVFSVHVRTDSEITIKELSAEFEYPFDSNDRIFLNGYQSWTDSYEHSVSGRMYGLGRVPSKFAEKHALSQYGDYNIVDYSSVPGELHGWSYGYIRNGSEYDLIGSLSEDTGFTLLYIRTNEDRIYAVKDCADLTINGDYCGLNLYMKSGTEERVFNRYFDRLGIRLNKDAKPIFGYTSWYRHYQGISKDIILSDLNAMCSLKHKSHVFQIDDGWQTAVGDWMSVDYAKFPDGMKKIAESIADKGMLPGIWLAPFVCEENSDLFKEHQSWLATNDNGEFIKGGSNWSGFYTLDIYNPEVREYLRDVFNVIINQLGFRLLKLDFLYAACIESTSYRTRGMIMSDGMKFLRSITKGAFILGCGVPLASAFGRVDYCRIGCDVSLDWNDKQNQRLAHRERVSTRNTILDSVFRRQLNGRAFLNDPDVFMLRSDNTSLTPSQKKCLAEINALTGGVLFTSDDVSGYTESQKKELDVMMALRDADVQYAELNRGILTVCFTMRGKEYTRKFKM